MTDKTQTDQAYSTTFERLTDMATHVGKEIGLTDWVTITQERIDAFANSTDDYQWIHINPEMAKKHSPYKTTIAHGFLVLSLASKFAYDCYSFNDVNMGINYGLDKVRFPNATPTGALLRGRISLMTYDEIQGGAQYKVKIVFELKGQQKPACVAEFIARAYADPEYDKKNKETKVTPKVEKETNEAVLYEKKGRVAVITFNRPEKYNAVNHNLIEGLNNALWKARKDESVRAIVLTGGGKGFCSGADMDSFGQLSPEEGKEYVTHVYQQVMRNFLQLKKPIIGAINGTAAGVGAAFALACDFRVMAENSALLYAFINIGLGPDGGASWFLARQVGYSRALEIAVEGKKLKGQECYDLGLANKLVDEGNILSTALQWANRLSEKATLAVGITKQDMQYAMNHDLYTTIAFEAEKQVDAFASHDLKEGVTAFLQKRPPKFIGK